MAKAELSVEISAKLDQLSKDLKQVDKKFDRTSKQIDKKAGGLDKTFSKLGGVIAAAFAGDQIISFAKQVIDVTAEFQKMEAVLSNTLGSTSAAQDAMDRIVKFASNTPFQVEQLTGAFVKLANQGFEPNIEQMRRLGDLAASTGKSFDQLAEAIIDAQVGEFERLKEFGIRAEKQGDKVKFTFKGVEQQVDFTSGAIQNYILGLGDAVGVSGSMNKISKTLGGQISNLKDQWTQFVRSVGEANKEELSNVIETLSEMLNGASNLGQVFEGLAIVTGFKNIKDASDASLQSIIKLGDAKNGKKIRDVVEPITSIIDKMGGEEAALKVDKFRKRFVSALTQAGETTEVANELFDAYAAGIKDNVSDLSDWAINNKEYLDGMGKAADAAIAAAKAQRKFNKELSDEEAYEIFLEKNKKEISEALKKYIRETKLAEDNTWALGKALESLRKVPSFSDIFTTEGSIGFDPSAIDEITSFIDADSIDEDAKRAESSITKMGEAMDKQMVKAKAVRFAVETAYQGLANVIVSSLGEAETAGGRFLRALIQNTSQVIAAATGQAVANAIVSGTQSGKGTGPLAAFTTPAFIASTVGSVIAAFAAIPKFAEGGIVGGSSTVGDRVTARLNSGEMVLNRTQQANLFSMANGGGGGSVNVVGKIRGRDILLSSERANNVRSRTRY